MTPEIEEFAQRLVRLVRDAAIQSNDQTLLPNARSPVAKRWRQAARQGPPEEFVRTLIPDVVDETIYYLLQAIDDGQLRLTYMAANGTSVDLTAEGLGELAGWFVGGESWVAQYSQERFVDDFADLRIDALSDDANEPES